MSAIKNLFSQTIVYGLSTMAVRMMNWALTPFYSYTFKDPSEFGIMNNLYAYIAFLNIIYMYGMETGFFRFATDKEQRVSVFRNINGALFLSSCVFTLLIWLFAEPLADLMSFPGQTIYIKLFALILLLDNLVNIPFAMLRLEGRPGKFLQYKLINVGTVILLNIFFFWPSFVRDYNYFSSIGFVHNPDLCVQYVFIANLISSGITFLLFLPQWLKYPPSLSLKVFKPIFQYSSPLIIVGLAGMVNELSDREMLKRLLQGSLKENLHQLGVYSAVYKLSIFMTLAIQGFRMGAEPFFFRHAQEKNAPDLYAKVLTYFSLVCILIFLSVTVFSNFIVFLLDAKYREALPILPVLLFANFCLGLYYNISAWYRIKDKTIIGTYITLAGAVLTLTANFLLIPAYGYFGAAVTHALTYFFMTALCYFIGQRYFPVPYQWKKIIGYFMFSLGLIALHFFVQKFNFSIIIQMAVSSLICLIYIAVIWQFELKLLLTKKENASF